MINEKFLKTALEKYPQKCLLVNLLSRRVAQLNNGAKPRVEADGMNKLNIALKEITYGFVSFKDTSSIQTRD